MTKAKYTDEQRAEMARENGRRLAEWRRMNNAVTGSEDRQ